MTLRDMKIPGKWKARIVSDLRKKTSRLLAVGRRPAARLDALFVT
jgi:hypothetical protein